LSPWEKLSRTEQETFNRKYLLLQEDVQQFAREMFLTVDRQRKEAAFQAFLALDMDTLTQVLLREREAERERRLLLQAERERFEREEEERQRRQREEEESLRRQREENTESKSWIQTEDVNRALHRRERPRHQEGRRINPNRARMNVNSKRRQRIPRLQHNRES